MARKRKQSRPKISKSARRRSFKWPRAFRLVPVEVKGKLVEHEHVLGQAALPPCPEGCSYLTKIATPVGDYCLYVCPEGAAFLIRC